MLATKTKTTRKKNHMRVPTPLLVKKLKMVDSRPLLRRAREMELEIDIVPNSSVKKSRASQRREDIAFYQLTANDPNFDQEMNRKALAEAFGKPQEIVKRPDPQPEGIPGIPGQQPQPQQAGQGGGNINLQDLI